MLRLKITDFQRILVAIRRLFPRELSFGANWSDSRISDQTSTTDQRQRALGVAADLQLASALSDCDLVEFIGGSPHVHGILKQPFTLYADGYLNIPGQPGLGVELDPDKVARYAPEAGGFLRAEFLAGDFR